MIMEGTEAAENWALIFYVLKQRIGKSHAAPGGKMKYVGFFFFLLESYM